MPQKPKYLDWLVDTKKTIKTKDGRPVNIFELKYDRDETVLSEWAKHFRNHYCLDEKIDDLRHGTGLSRKDFLLQIKFPDLRKRPGPSVRAGDFTEILVADYIQFILNYKVPRYRHGNKIRRNDSPKGIDILAFKVTDIGKARNDDILLTCEVKAALQSANTDTLVTALIDSKKDFNIRQAESLNAMKQRLKEAGRTDEATLVERFQNKVDLPYIEITGAVAVHSNHTWDDVVIADATAEDHPNDKIFLLAIKGEQLMTLANQLYERAANEA